MGSTRRSNIVFLPRDAVRVRNVRSVLLQKSIPTLRLYMKRNGSPNQNLLADQRDKMFALKAVSRRGLRARSPGTTKPDHAQLKPCFASGSERIRLPVTAKIALHTAGKTGGSAGSPSPVGG